MKWVWSYLTSINFWLCSSHGASREQWLTAKLLMWPEDWIIWQAFQVLIWEWGWVLDHVTIHDMTIENNHSCCGHWVSLELSSLIALHFTIIPNNIGIYNPKSPNNEEWPIFHLIDEVIPWFRDNLLYNRFLCVCCDADMFLLTGSGSKPKDPGRRNRYWPQWPRSRTSSCKNPSRL